MAPAPGEAEAEELAAELEDSALGLRSSADLDPLLERVGDARVVMLGEASHGTSEYYRWRTALSRRLIREKGFSLIAVEGDWPDCYQVNRYVKEYAGSAASAPQALRAFERWPTWMWANWEVTALAEWMREHNANLDAGSRVGFYGLDVYSLWESLEAVMDYLRRTDPQALELARKAYHCFEPFGEDVQAYAQSTAFVPSSCEDEVVELLSEIRQRAPQYADDDESRFSAEQNARSLVGAERYYRTMMQGSRESWNQRDRHMLETLRNLLAEHGPDSKAIVWEHNTHVGDARATDMARRGMVNTGQLAREEYGTDDVVLVGFGSYRGTVVAGRYWGAATERMELPPAREESWEHVLHELGRPACLLLSDSLPDAAARERGHRAVGVVYDPGGDRYGNYVRTVLPRRYDAFVFLDETEALHPLGREAEVMSPPETYPWGE